MAVFTLPQELLGFYKKNIEYITAHAVDPDKRRYALKTEFARHYIDIDHWDTIPFHNVPRSFPEATMKFGSLLVISGADTINVEIPDDKKMEFYYDHIYLNRYDLSVRIDNDSFHDFSADMLRIKSDDIVIFDNELVQYGVVPYFLEEFYQRLVRAFFEKDIKSILKISADIGHYIADGHVPLHTTENYNGQMTDQIGIHAFWESRLPELFADQTYDFVVGKAQYIEDMEEFIWEFIEESHRLLPDVLAIEMELKNSFPEDQQFCFDERLERTTRIQCEAYSEEYHNRMDGMVEKRMQDAVLAIGSFWYSAWVEGGQPDLISEGMEDLQVLDAEEKQALEDSYNQGNIFGRKH